VRLVVGQPCVLGRSPSCDLPIPSGGASRRHAHVCWERDGIVIRDLSSTNGTYVNGEKLDGARVLQAGDRIMIGDRTVTFCHVASAIGVGDPASDTDTVAYISHPTEDELDEEAFQGEFSEIPAFAVFQILEMGMKSGLVEIVRGEETQRVWFHAGMPVHAVAGGMDGKEAAMAAVRPADGRFSFKPGAKAPTRTIQVSIAELLLEASRRMDEDKR
jgi:hypothetical protein